MSIAERFWSKVRKSDWCWVWIGQRSRYGYGVLEIARHVSGKRQRRIYKAHRISFTLYNGPIPDGFEVCHHCDNPPCVRPDHLFLGTHAENMRDMVRKGRHWLRHRPGQMQGERNPAATISEAQALEIRQMVSEGARQSEVARLFDVSISIVSRIVNRKTWGHV